MISLNIEKIDKNKYLLKDENETHYELTLKFIDVDFTLTVGDKIYMHEQLLDESYEGYSDFYTIGNLNSLYGRANVTINDIDAIRVVANNKTILLKRLYG